MAKTTINTKAEACAKAKPKPKPKPKTKTCLTWSRVNRLREKAASATEAVFALSEPNPVCDGDVDTQRDLYERLRDIVSELSSTGSSLCPVADWFETSLRVFEAGFEAEYGHHPSDDEPGSGFARELKDHNERVLRTQLLCAKLGIKLASTDADEGGRHE